MTDATSEQMQDLAWFIEDPVALSDIRLAVDRALDAVQDFIVERLGEPWPPSESHTSLQVPNVQIENEWIQLGYGEELRFPSIALEDLRSAQ